MADIYKIGSHTVVDAADVVDINHDINYCGPDPASHQGISKFKGMEIVINLFDVYYMTAIALGNTSSSGWAINDTQTNPIIPS